MMIDMWINDQFYVVQIEEQIFGISHITKDNPGFDTVPDLCFSDQQRFKEHLELILAS